jgi:type 1 glutamine amidotransferase
MKWLKITLVVLALVVVVGGIGTYMTLKSIGIIPRADYDTEPPTLPAFTKPAVLVFSKTNGFIHTEALPAADAMFVELAEQNGWEVFATKNAAVHNAVDLEKFSLVVWNNVSGDVLTEQQRADLKAWLEQGGGWLGVHASGGDFSYQWDWYVNTLIGAQFVGHTMSPQFQDADVDVVDDELEMTAHLLPGPWRVPNEEWYAFDANPRQLGYEILLTLDEASYITKGESFMGTDSMEGEHPIAWRHPQGEGRVVYSAIGHQAVTYSIPEYREFLSKAMRWAMGE